MKKKTVRKAKRSSKSTKAKRASLITRRELALKHDVSMTRISKWERDGMPVAVRGQGGRPSLFDQRAVREWLATRDQRAEENAPVDLALERARRERAQAKMAEQLVAMRARELIPALECEKALADEIARMRSTLLAWEPTLVDRFHRASTSGGLSELRREIRAAVEEVLEDLSSLDDLQPSGPSR